MVAVPEEVRETRKLIWLVDTLERLTGFPPAVRKGLGFALYQAQIGDQHESAKMLRGFSEAVWRFAPMIRAERIARFTWRNSGMRSTSCMLFRRRQRRESQRPAENWS